MLCPLPVSRWLLSDPAERWPDLLLQRVPEGKHDELRTINDALTCGFAICPDDRHTRSDASRIASTSWMRFSGAGRSPGFLQPAERLTGEDCFGEVLGGVGLQCGSGVLDPGLHCGYALMAVLDGLD